MTASALDAPRTRRTTSGRRRPLAQLIGVILLLLSAALPLLGVPWVAAAETIQAQYFALPGGGVAADVAIGPGGRVWFVARSPNRVGWVAAGGTVVEIPLPTDSTPEAIAVGADNAAWFILRERFAVGRADEAGRVTEIAVPDYRGETTRRADYPWYNDILAGPDGNLWIGAELAVGRLAPAGGVTWFPFPLKRPNLYYYGADKLAIGPDGNIWIAMGGSIVGQQVQDSEIGRVTPSGQLTFFNLSDNLQPEYGITGGPDGNVWFTDRVNNRVARITPGGVVTAYPVPARPRDIVAAADGNLWFTFFQSSDSLGRVTPTGVITTLSLAGQITGAGALATGPDGALWFTASGGRLGRIFPAGGGPASPGPAPSTPPAPGGALPPALQGAPLAFPPEATRFTIAGAFRAQWEQHGGLAINGYPLSDVFQQRLDDGNPYWVQYFERVRMEYHPEIADPQFQVLLGQFGRRLHPADPRVAPLPGTTYFEETGHNVPPDFLAYWQERGGLAQFGFPLSEVFRETLEDGKEYEVQYFERARFERHPEAGPGTILLGQFGRRILAETPR